MRLYAKNDPRRLIPASELAENERLMAIDFGETKPHQIEAKSISEAFESYPKAAQIDKVRVIHGPKGAYVETLATVTRPELRKEMSRHLKKS